MYTTYFDPSHVCPCAAWNVTCTDPASGIILLLQDLPLIKKSAFSVPTGMQVGGRPSSTWPGHGGPQYPGRSMTTKSGIWPGFGSCKNPSIFTVPLRPLATPAAGHGLDVNLTPSDFTSRPCLGMPPALFLGSFWSLSSAALLKSLPNETAS